MRILYLTYMPTGVGQTLRSLECAKAASDLGHEVRLKFLNRHYQSPNFCYEMMERYRSDKFRAFHPPKPSFGSDKPGYSQAKSSIGRIVDSRPTLKGLYRQIAASMRFVPVEMESVKQFKPDVIVARPDQIFSFVVTSRLCSVPVVLETDGPVEELDSRWGLDSRWVRPLDTWRAHRAAALLYISKTCGELWVKKKIPRERLFYAPNGVDPDVFKPSDPAKRSVMRARLGLGDGHVIGFSGNMREWHGVDQLIQAALPLLRRDASLKLLFVGAVDDPSVLNRQEVPADIRKRQFVFTGLLPYSRMGEHIDLADCMAMPFPYSDFFFPSAMKLFEAMSVGKLIVAPRMGQIEEVLGGLKSPILYDPRGPAALTQSLEEAKRRAAGASPGIPMGADARDCVARAHTWSHRGRAVVDACEYAIRGENRKRRSL